jgi:F0F1-type ATP synthase assembly protein I
MSNRSNMGFYKILAQASSIGLSMVLALGLGFALGWWVDSRWPQLSPWGKMGGLVLGIAAAYRNLFVMFNRLNRPPDKRPDGTPKP